MFCCDSKQIRNRNCVQSVKHCFFLNIYNLIDWIVNKENSCLKFFSANSFVSRIQNLISSVIITLTIFNMNFSQINSNTLSNIFQINISKIDFAVNFFQIPYVCIQIQIFAIFIFNLSIFVCKDCPHWSCVFFKNLSWIWITIWNIFKDFWANLFSIKIWDIRIFNCHKLCRITCHKCIFNIPQETKHLREFCPIQTSTSKSTNKTFCLNNVFSWETCTSFIISWNSCKSIGIHIRFFNNACSTSKTNKTTNATVCYDWIANLSAIFKLIKFKSTFTDKTIILTNKSTNKTSIGRIYWTTINIRVHNRASICSSNHSNICRKRIKLTSIIIVVCTWIIDINITVFNSSWSTDRTRDEACVLHWNTSSSNFCLTNKSQILQSSIQSIDKVFTSIGKFKSDVFIIRIDHSVKLVICFPSRKSDVIHNSVIFCIVNFFKITLIIYPYCSTFAVPISNCDRNLQDDVFIINLFSFIVIEIIWNFFASRNYFIIFFTQTWKRNVDWNFRNCPIFIFNIFVHKNVIKPINIFNHIIWQKIEISFSTFCRVNVHIEDLSYWRCWNLNIVWRTAWRHIKWSKPNVICITWLNRCWNCKVFLTCIWSCQIQINFIINSFVHPLNRFKSFNISYFNLNFRNFFKTILVTIDNFQDIFDRSLQICWFCRNSESQISSVVWQCHTWNIIEVVFPHTSAFRYFIKILQRRSECEVFKRIWICRDILILSHWNRNINKWSVYIAQTQCVCGVKKSCPNIWRKISYRIKTFKSKETNNRACFMIFIITLRNHSNIAFERAVWNHQHILRNWKPSIFKRFLTIKRKEMHKCGRICNNT